RPDQLAVGILDVQRVLAHDRQDVVAERDAEFVEDAPDLRLADLVVRLVVEVDLVDRAAGGDDAELVHGKPVCWGRWIIRLEAGPGDNASRKRKPQATCRSDVSRERADIRIRRAIATYLAPTVNDGGLCAATRRSAALPLEPRPQPRQ